MDKNLLNIKIMYDKMGVSEKKIANFILQNPDGLLPLSISELAEKCGSSEATIVRFSRRLGYGGYQQLKISLAKQEGSHNIRENISPDDSPEKVFAKVCDDIYCSLEKTKNVINGETFAAACDLLMHSERTLIFGLGNSASVAEDMAHKLLRLGFDATAYSDNHMQAIAASHLSERCVAVGITHSGSSKDIIDALRTAKKRGAATIAITNIGKSPVYSVADYVLSTVSDEINYSILGLNSRIAQLAIIDTIYYYAVCNTKNAREEAERTEEALLDKKY